MVGRPTMRLRNLIVGAIVCASMIVPAAPAFAQNAAQSGYSEPSGSIQEQISTRRDRKPKDDSSTRTTPNTRQGLPFTGLDVGLIMAAGGVLLVMGVSIRRLSRSEVA